MKTENNYEHPVEAGEYLFDTAVGDAMNPTLKKMKFSVEIKRYEDINEILRRIEQTKRVKFEIKDRTINVYE